jgi:hypothetical protein
MVFRKMKPDVEPESINLDEEEKKLDEKFEDGIKTLLESDHDLLDSFALEESIIQLDEYYNIFEGNDESLFEIEDLLIDVDWGTITLKEAIEKLREIHEIVKARPCLSPRRQTGGDDDDPDPGMYQIIKK